MYFEHSLPTVAPSYINPLQKEHFEAVTNKVILRMEKLEKALILSNMPGEQFEILAKALFDMKDKDGESLVDVLPYEEIASFALKGLSLPYTKRHDWPNANVIVDSAFVTTKEWETIRALGIGGSDAAVITGTSKFKGKKELFFEKTGIPVEVEEIDPGLDFIFSYGHTVEPLVIETFCKKSGAKVIHETRMFSKKGYPFITANIDGILEFPNGNIYILEAKTTTSFNKDAWEGNKVPAYYMPQVRQYLSVLDDERVKGAYIACIYGNTLNDFIYHEIKRDLKEEQTQVALEEEFWTESIEKGIIPDDTLNPKEEEKLIKKYSGFANANIPEMSLSIDFESVIEDFLAADEKLAQKKKEMQGQIEKLEAERDSYAIKIKAEMGPAITAGIINGSVRYDIKWKPRQSTKIDKDKLQLSWPDAYEACVSINPESSRSFSIKKYSIK